MNRVVLIGLMGSGKTTVGRLLAERLGWPLRDSDRAIEGQTGRTVRELMDELGEEEMHALEAQQLLAMLAEPGRCVVAAAASAIESRTAWASDHLASTDHGSLCLVGRVERRWPPGCERLWQYIGRHADRGRSGR